MMELFKVVQLENRDKIGNLKTEAHSQVKSTKYFPIYMIDGKKMIFKPLSKTKPLTTPFFAYSEVYWSYIIKKYFDSRTPRYYLAVAKGITEEQSKYFEQGVLVESLTPNDEEMINLYDYFLLHPDSSLDIKDYVNYCMMNYDYTKILLSDFIKDNRAMGEQLAFQILLSVLRQDQNFHYENINIMFNELVPPIDFEFSTPFLYPDKEDDYHRQQKKYISALTIKYEDEEDDEMSNFVKQMLMQTGFTLYSTLMCNISLIVRLYPDIVLKFIKNLDKLIEDLPQIIISDPDNYIGDLNSDYWEVWHAYFKENDLDKYEELKEKIKLGKVDKDYIFKRISNDVLRFSKFFSLLLKTYLIAYYNGIDDLENLTIKRLLVKLNITDNVIIEDIDIDTKRLKLKKVYSKPIN